MNEIEPRQFMESSLLEGEAYLTPGEKETLATYDREAVEWSAGHDQPEFWEKEVRDFRKLLPEGKLIEVGAGGGRDARMLIAAGYDYIGTDISEPMLKEALKRNPEGKFEHKSIYKLDYPEQSFDGFWMSNTLHHVPKARMPEALQSLSRILKPGAVGFISVKEGEGEEMVSEVAEAETTGSYQRLFSYLKEGELTQLLQGNGFEIIEARVYPPGTHVVMNKKTTWLVMFVRKT